MKRVTQLTAPLRLETGDEVLDAMFRFAKLRAGESIFDTHGGPLHSPGGYSYYAATWCNDEIEYAGPWLAFTGDPLGMEASLNAYRQYIPFMGPDYRHIPSSIIAEGVDFWEGAGDRGDAAMYLYGASQFALFGGDPSGIPHPLARHPLVCGILPAGSSTPTAWWPPTRTSWRGVSQPGRPTSAPPGLYEGGSA